MPCASWPCAAPPIALMTRCAPGETYRDKSASGTRGTPFCYALVTAAATKKLVRTAARLAAKFGSVWHAVYVETPQLHGLPENQRRAILSALRLAQELGAETATLSDPQEDKAILRYARSTTWARLSLDVASTAAGLAANLLPTGWPAARRILI